MTACPDCEAVVRCHSTCALQRHPRDGNVGIVSNDDRAATAAASVMPRRCIICRDVFIPPRRPPSRPPPDTCGAECKGKRHSDTLQSRMGVWR